MREKQHCWCSAQLEMEEMRAKLAAAETETAQLRAAAGGIQVEAVELQHAVRVVPAPPPLVVEQQQGGGVKGSDTPMLAAAPRPLSSLLARQLAGDLPGFLRSPESSPPNSPRSSPVPPTAVPELAPQLGRIPAVLEIDEGSTKLSSPSGRPAVQPAVDLGAGSSPALGRPSHGASAGGGLAGLLADLAAQKQAGSERAAELQPAAGCGSVAASLSGPGAVSSLEAHQNQKGLPAECTVQKSEGGTAHMAVSGQEDGEQVDSPPDHAMPERCCCML